MKKIIFLSLLLWTIGCSSDNAPAVGADRDAHGCIGSAGYTFSTLKNKCIRLWEEGITLLPAQKQDAAVMAAYVIMGENQAELFLPGRTTPVSLSQQYVGGKGQWSATDASGWKLIQPEPSAWQLENNGAVQYTSKTL